MPFTNAYAPGDKKFDFDINQVSISDDRKKAVDFSSGYYDVAQTVVSVKGSKIDGATRSPTLKERQARRPGRHHRLHRDHRPDRADRPSRRSTTTTTWRVQALKNGQVDGIVVDLPTAFYITAAELDDGTIVGQLPPGPATPEQFGLVLDKGSPLTGCVTQRWTR